MARCVDRFVPFAWLALALAAACGDDAPAGSSSGGDAGDAEDAGGDQAAALPMGGLYGDAVTEIALEVDYEAGAEPYVGATLPFGDPWDLFVTNAGALFAESPKTITVPRTLEEMEEISVAGGPDFTSDEIAAIAAAHRDEADSGSRRVFYVVFLDGYFDDASGRQAAVLGVSLGGTGIIAIFKQPVESTALPRQVEQVTLVHELGHTVGLVNNGVPMASPHQDEAHGAHCNNPDCVMYWSVEGSDVIGYVRDRVLSNEASLFGDECLDDARAAAGAPAGGE